MYYAPDQPDDAPADTGALRASQAWLVRRAFYSVMVYGWICRKILGDYSLRIAQLGQWGSQKEDMHYCEQAEKPGQCYKSSLYGDGVTMKACYSM